MLSARDFVASIGNYISEGDIDADYKIGLNDTLKALQTLTSKIESEPTYKEADVNSDGNIGVEEAAYCLQRSLRKRSSIEFIPMSTSEKAARDAAVDFLRVADSLSPSERQSHLLSVPGIESAECSDYSCLMEINEGFSFCYFYDIDADDISYALTRDTKSFRKPSFSFEGGRTGTNLAATCPPGRKVMFINPFYHQYAHHSNIIEHMNEIESFFEQSGYEFEKIMNEDATEESFLKMQNSDYGVVIVSSHGHEDGWVTTGEIWDGGSWPEDSRRFGTGMVHGFPGITYLTLKSAWWDKMNLNGKLIVFLTCHSAGNEELQSFLRNAGAGYVLGWDDKSEPQATMLFSKLFFEEALINNRDLNDAIQTAKMIGYNDHPVLTDPSYYYTINHVVSPVETADFHIDSCACFFKDPPSNPSALILNDRIEVIWDLMDEAIRYYVYAATVSGVSPDNYDSLPGGVKYTVTDNKVVMPAGNGGTFYFVIVGVGLGECHSPPSAEISIRVDAPPVVSDLEVPAEVDAGEGFNVRFKYDDANGISDINLLVIESSDPNHSPMVFSDAADLSLQFDLLQETASLYRFEDAGDYTIKVYASDQGGAKSNEIEQSIHVRETIDPDDSDDDGDGFSENQGDCDDDNDEKFPGNTEICGDGIDQDCDGNDLPCGTSVYSPENVSAQSGDSQTTISRGNVENATGYNIYWNTVGNVTKQDNSITGISQNSFTHNGLTNGTRYFYAITAQNAFEESRLSEEISATPQAFLPCPGDITGSLDFEYRGQDVFVSGQFAYVLAGNFYVVDIKDPGDMHIVGTTCAGELFVTTVRHEVAQIAVLNMDINLLQNPVFCNRYSTGTCVRSNLEV